MNNVIDKLSQSVKLINRIRDEEKRKRLLFCYSSISKAQTLKIVNGSIDLDDLRSWGESLKRHEFHLGREQAFSQCLAILEAVQNGREISDKIVSDDEETLDANGR